MEIEVKLANKYGKSVQFWAEVDAPGEAYPVITAMAKMIGIGYLTNEEIADRIVASYGVEEVTNKKISMIKDFRGQTGMSLKDSKFQIEAAVSRAMVFG